MLKNFLMRKLIESKMKDVPKEQQEMIFSMLEKNPEFFEKIATEIQAKISGGMDQMEATMKVMQAHEAELRAIAGK
jgi:hypothetical protein